MRVNVRIPATLAVVGLLGVTLAACGDSPNEPLVTISPADPGTNDRLLLQVAERSGITYEVAWTVDGEAMEDLGFDVEPELTTRGQVWEATVTPVDGDGKAYDASVVSITIGNAAPGGIVTLNPSAPLTGQDLIAQPGFIDPDDGDTVSATYSWTQNGSDAGITGDTVSGDKLKKGDVWQVTVVASDGSNESPPVTATATVANTPPSAEGAIISPEVVFDDTTVSCNGIRFVDNDGDAEQYKYIWKVDGAVVSNEAELTGQFFDRGQNISCELIPTDGEDDGTRVFSAPVRVGNGVPTIDSITIDNSAPNRNEAVTFTLAGLNDADGDEVSLDIWWLVNGRGVSQEESLSTDLFKKGDEIRVRVTPSDGIVDGETLLSDAVTVVNAPPVVMSSAFMASPIYTDSMLAPATTVVDNDGDAFTITYTWKVNGTTVGDSSGTLDGTDTEGNGFDRSNTVAYTVVANDGEEDGAPYNSPVMTVANKPPTIPDVTLDPGLLLPTEDVLCTTDGEIIDADGDTVTVSMTWTVDGTSYKGLTGTTTYTGDTIPYNATELAEKWGCTITAKDGTDTTVSEEGLGIIRPETIIYTVEDSSGLSGGTSCTGDDGETGYYGTANYLNPFEWEFDDVYETDPDSVTVSWRQGRWDSSSSYGYYYFNGARLSYTNLGISRNTTCDSGRTYAVTFSGIKSAGFWNSGDVNSAGIAGSSWTYYNIGVYYDEDYEYGAMRINEATE